MVMEGMEEVDRIASVRTNGQDKPFEDQTIASITVDTHGVEYPAPRLLADPFARYR